MKLIDSILAYGLYPSNDGLRRSALSAPIRIVLQPEVAARVMLTSAQDGQDDGVIHSALPQLVTPWPHVWIEWSEGARMRVADDLGFDAAATGLPPGDRPERVGYLVTCEGEAHRRLPVVGTPPRPRREAAPQGRRCPGVTAARWAKPWR